MGIIKSIKPPAEFNNSLASSQNYINTKIQVERQESCFKQEC